MDLAHDTLITGWPELAGWIAERRDDLQTQRRLETRAATGVLLTSSELPEFLCWVEATAAPAGQLLGASDALRVLVRRSVAARRIRRGALGGDLVAAMVIAIVFGLQAQRLREEKAKTQQSISEAMKAANVIVFEVDDELQKVAGASSMRERLLKRSRELVARLRKLGDLKEGDQRIAMAGKAAEAQPWVPFSPGQRLDISKARSGVCSSSACPLLRCTRLRYGPRVRSGRAVKTTFEGAVRDEVRYWLARPMVERVSAVELGGVDISTLKPPPCSIVTSRQAPAVCIRPLAPGCRATAPGCAGPSCTPCAAPKTRRPRLRRSHRRGTPLLVQ